MKKFLSVGLIFMLVMVVLAGYGWNKLTAAEPDVVATASIVKDGVAFEKAISENGNWIIATLNDLTINHEIVVAGEFRNKGLATNDLYRKLAPYTQDSKHKIIDRFTITAPKLIVKSPNFKLQGGTFVGDVYVEANGFTVQDATVKGNVYFANNDYKKSFVNQGTVTGATEIKANVDAVATASIVRDGDAFEKAIGENGNWIIATLNDLTINHEIVVAGEFRNKGLATNDLYRKLAPYTQDDKHKIIDRFTITAPKLIVKSPNFKLQGGTFVGDVYVEAYGFTVQDATVKGNVYFANNDYKKSFVNKGTVTGATEIKANVDVVATASIVRDGDAFEKAISANGNWIVATLNDLTFDHEIVVAGEFRNKGLATNDLYRKLAPYTQDDKHKIIDRFTITAPKLTVKSPNFKLQGGTFVGDVYVEANGFTVQDATVKGNIYFANNAYKKSFVNKGTVTGTTTVK